MPTLEILDKNGQIMPSASNYVFSIMLFPSDEKARISWRQNIFCAHLMKTAAENFDFPDAEPFENEIVQHIRLHGMTDWLAKQTWVKRTEVVWRNGAYSGILLYHLINMHKVGMETSLNKALWILAKTLPENSNNDQFWQKARPLKKCWSEFRSVASLWASAWRFDFNYPADLSEPIYDQLTKLLSLAQWHENEITSIVPRGASKPILRKEDMWQVPDIPQMEPVEFIADRDLVNYYEKALADYSAELVVNSYSTRRNKKTNK